MSDTSAPADSGETTETPPDTGKPNAPAETDWEAEATKWKTQARKHEERSKANAKAASELETVRKASMTEQEKAVAVAHEEAKAEALATVGVSRAGDAIRYSVGDRIQAAELDDLLDDLNLAKFVKEDGSVDRDKVTSYVERITPKRAGLDLGQGARGGSTTGAGSFLTDAIRKARS